MGMAMLAALFGAALFIFFILPSLGGSADLARAASPAAQQISTLPTVSVVTCDDVRQVAPQWNLTVGEVNTMAGAVFDKIGLNKLDCDHILDYVPLVSSYDDLVGAAGHFDSGNDSSVKAFYAAGMIFGADATLLDAKVAYELGYAITGYLNDLLGLRGVVSACGYECYGELLSAIHWFVRGYASEILTQFDTWVLQNLTNLPANW
jgi:hypothetical protein